MHSAGLDPQVPEALSRRFDGPHSDVWLIANNLKLRRFPLRDLPLTADSLLIQFNRARFFESFAGLDCHKDFVFAGKPGGYHGFEQGVPAQPLQRQAFRSLRLTLIGSDGEASPEALAAAVPDAAVREVPRAAMRLRGYPTGLVASSGFVVLQIHAALEAARARAGQARRPIHLVGFTGFARAAWHGHDWWAEQRWLREAPVTLHARDARDSLHALRGLRWWLHHLKASRRGLRP
mgnify:CR=1 FL=1